MIEIPSSEQSPQNYSSTYHQDESPRARKARINQKRRIRKQKIKIKYIQAKNPQILPLTRQEKAAIQKVKNREAAQKSRENKKYYVNSLERQIQQLKEKLKQKIYCQNCRGILSSSTSQDYSFPQRELVLLDSQDRQQLNNQIPFQNQITLNEEQPFGFGWIRNSNIGSSQYLGQGIFVFMIIIALFCFSMNPSSNTQGALMNFQIRDLQQVSMMQQQRSEALNQNFEKMQSFNDNQIEVYKQNQKGLIPFNQIFRPFNNTKCMRQIFSQRIEPGFEQILNLRTQIQRSINPNIMFCQLPLIYRGEMHQNGFTKNMDIIVNGKDIRQIIPTHKTQQFGFRHNIDDNSLYQIKTQVIEIVKLDLLSCV